jgi:hypothetical protein
MFSYSEQCLALSVHVLNNVSATALSSSLAETLNEEIFHLTNISQAITSRSPYDGGTLD